MIWYTDWYGRLMHIQYFDVHQYYPNTVRHYRHPTWIYLGGQINSYQIWCSPRAGVDWWNRDANPGHELGRNTYASTEAIPNNIIIYNLLWYYPPNILSSRYVCWQWKRVKKTTQSCDVSWYFSQTLVEMVRMSTWNQQLLRIREQLDLSWGIPLNRKQTQSESKHILWKGNGKMKGFYHPVLFANHWYGTGMMICQCMYIYI